MVLETGNCLLFDFFLYLLRISFCELNKQYLETLILGVDSSVKSALVLAGHFIY